MAKKPSARDVRRRTLLTLIRSAQEQLSIAESSQKSARKLLAEAARLIDETDVVSDAENRSPDDTKTSRQSD